MRSVGNPVQRLIVYMYQKYIYIYLYGPELFSSPKIIICNIISIHDQYTEYRKQFVVTTYMRGVGKSSSTNYRVYASTIDIFN